MSHLVMGRLRPDLWVNPQHVVSLEWHRFGREPTTPPNSVEVAMANGERWTVDGTIDDVARLLGWFDYTVVWPGVGSPIVKVKP